MIRLQKFMSESGVASRRKSEELIIAGKVSVNGVVIKDMGYKVTGTEEIEVEGRLINKEEKVYFILYKPSGIISSTKDEKNRETVIDLIETDKKIFPVGRLDYDTSGLLLLTNDGELSNALTHPKGDIEKVYSVKIEGLVIPEHIYRLRAGIMLDGRKTKPARVKLRKIDKKNKKSYVEISITEGRNHQVKNMFQYFGYKVLKLKRTNYSFLDLEGLKSGEYRKLTLKEIKSLYFVVQDLL